MSANIPTIAVDAMGGDQAPRCEVEAAVFAATELGVRVALVGPEDLLRAELERRAAGALPIEVVQASEAITMDDSAARAVRQKRDSSIRTAMRLVHEGRAQGVVSAGNTGAVMATAKLVLGTLPSVDRPALAAIFPQLSSNHLQSAPGDAAAGPILIDAGANVDCKPEQLCQFAVMGVTYSRLLLRIDSPRVGLLSIGSEASKGNETTREAHHLLERLPLHFIGNVEGRDLYSGIVDVIVCDGFTGNVALKSSEGLADAVKRLLRGQLANDVAANGAVARIAEELSRRMDYGETGGAPLLGIKGVCTICHGSSGPRAIRNAIRLTREFVAASLNEKMETELSRLSAPAGTARQRRELAN
jgi:glycerol-3-phosphate acyltransferase PlsX